MRLLGARPSTDRRIPQPIFVAALIGVDELLRIDFPPAASPEMYPDLAIEGIRLKLARWNRDFNRRKGLGSYQLPAFGRPLGFVVNYSPDHAGWFDPLGNVVVVLSKAHRIGHVTLNLEGSSIPLSAVLKIGSSADDMIITDHEGKLARGEICRHEAEILSLRPYCPQCPSAPHYKLGKKISYLFGCGSLWPKKTSWGAGAVGARGAVTVWDRIDEDDQAISSAQRYNDACAFLALRFYCPSAPPH
jgi:hypothetical protein